MGTLSRFINHSCEVGAEASFKATVAQGGRVSHTAAVPNSALGFVARRFLVRTCFLSPKPNAYAKVVPIEAHSHIILFAKRTIEPGEEIVYDYKFAPDSDASSGCNCGSKNCSGFLGGN